MRNLILIAILFIAKSFYSQNDSSFQIIIESLKVENKNLQLINDSLKVINSKLGFEIMILNEEVEQLNESDYYEYDEMDADYYEEETYDSIAVEIIGINSNNDSTIFLSFQSFLNNITSNTTYYLDFNDIKLDRLNKSLSGKHFLWKAYVVEYDEYMDDEDWGISLTLKGLENVKLIGIDVEYEKHGHSKTKIQSSNTSGTILIIDSCKNIKIENFWLGHSPSATGCTAGVLAIKNSFDITINQCYLYGTGIEGLSVFDSDKITVINTEIFDCSQSVFNFNNSNNVIFNNCSFYSNKGRLRFNNSSNIKIQYCKSYNNEGGGVDLYNCNNVKIYNTDWRTNSLESSYWSKTFLMKFRDAVSDVLFSNCSIYDKDEIYQNKIFLFDIDVENISNYYQECKIKIEDVKYNDTSITIDDIKSKYIISW